MKKTISGVLLALASVCALAACGKKTTTEANKTTGAGGETTKKEVVANGKVINFYCWNNEFQTRLRKYYPGFVKTVSATSDLLADGTSIYWTMVANEGGAYQTSLDLALNNGLVDMFCFEADYATKYVKSEYVVDMDELGLTEAMKGQYKYTQDIVTNADGKIVGSSWQATPGIILYNTTTMNNAGLTAAETEEALNGSYDTFKALAAKMEAKDSKFAAMAGYADWYRAYSNNMSDKMLKAGKLTADKNLFQWVLDTAEFNKLGYLKGDSSGYGLWGDDWNAAQAADSDVLTVFSCPWYTDFCLTGNCKVEKGESSPYKAVAGYQGWFWGGTWLTATQDGIEDATKKATITDIIKEMTTDADVLLALSKGELDFTNNEAAMEALAKDDAGKSTYFGGQNVYAIYAKSVKFADLSNASDYDQYISEEMQNKFLPYIQAAAGNKSYKDKVDEKGNPVYKVDEDGEYILDKDGNKIVEQEEVNQGAESCWAEFVKIIKEKTNMTINLPTGVTITAEGIAIAK